MQRLIEEAKKARLNAYAPYSNFKVGAAIKMKDGTIITGCNVENASYGLAICAERNALTSMINMGYKKNEVEMMVIVADTPGPCSPCGACRQVMDELIDNDAKIILTNLKDDIKETNMSELLPYSFKDGDLN